MTHGAPIKKRQNGDVHDEPEDDGYNGMVKPPDGGWGQYMILFVKVLQ